jgi:hypothetical protein
MDLVERSTEWVARTLDRRAFMKRSAVGLFALASASAARAAFPTHADAATCRYFENGTCTCNPPGGVFCTSYHTTYCSGANCAGGCTFDTQYWPTACWCTATCCYDGGYYTGYYQCCDCSCPSHTCGCKSFVTVCSSASQPPGFGCC